ncbi:hypothetical protein [Ferrimonas balearica]|uniref:hypothetical protein n=1 Tax=Ferrimonas balearica TaxID=44012 RepID=UPI001F3040A7|nr:hypothetical protein [Ferrimonas balearica]MBY6019332.1 hypothetical protein [Halomonas denitrificans]MBY6096310.1 hypothetical protein [Ferrimonas balearica]
MNIIIPIAGRSSRFPDLKPKWMLTHPQGDFMVVEAIKGLDLSNVQRIVLVGLAQHEQEYGFVAALTAQFEALGIADRVEFVLLEAQTRHQPETVARAIEQARIEGPIYIKDSDNYFVDTPRPGNLVACYDLHSLDNVNARNKSYLEVNADGHIINIVEKQIVSSTFCVGGYGFADAAQFMACFERLQAEPDLYLSHMIFQMVSDGETFGHQLVSDYVDWGTIKEWNAYKAHYSTLFVDLDGTLVRNSAQFTEPKWGTTEAIADNVATLNALHASGTVQIIITTSRKEAYRDVTVAQLERLGIRYDQLIMGLVHGRRIVINDYAKSNPYKSCDAINIKRNSSDLKDKLEDSVGFHIDLGQR